MFRSIRWTLQMWHAAILAAVLVAFGSVMFYYLPLIEYRRIDDDLAHVAYRVGSSVRPVFRPTRRGPFRAARWQKIFRTWPRPSIPITWPGAAGPDEAAERLAPRRPPRPAPLPIARHGQVGRDRLQDAARSGRCSPTRGGHRHGSGFFLSPLFANRAACGHCLAGESGRRNSAGRQPPRCARRPGSAAGIPRTPTGDAH